MPAKGAKGSVPPNKGKPMPAAQLAKQRANQPHNRKVPNTGQDGQDARNDAAVRGAHYHE